MLRPIAFALPIIVSLVACGGATETTSETSSHPASSSSVGSQDPTDHTPGWDVGNPRVDDSDARAVGPAPSSLARAFVIEGQTLGGVRGAHDTCAQGSVRYEVDLAAKHVTVKRCAPGPTTGDGYDGYATKTTVDRALTADEVAGLEKQFAELKALPMPSSCAYDGHAYRLEVGTGDAAYLDADYNCMHLGSVRYVSSLRPLGETLAAFDGSTEPPF